jgi:O-antigen ligase
MSTKQKEQKIMELENAIKEIEKDTYLLEQIQNKIVKMNNQLINPIQLSKKDKYLEFSNPNSSEGYRLLIWKKTFDYLLENNLLFHGSGYIGTFIVDNKMKFSAHSQYVDTLFRTGVIGLIITFFIYIKLLLKFYKTNCYMFSSLIGVLVYGLLHETFKQSQGGFILMFYIISYLHENYKSKVYSE